MPISAKKKRQEQHIIDSEVERGMPLDKAKGVAIAHVEHPKKKKGK